MGSCKVRRMVVALTAHIGGSRHYDAPNAGHHRGNDQRAFAPPVVRDLRNRRDKSEGYYSVGLWKPLCFPRFANIFSHICPDLIIQS